MRPVWEAIREKRLVFDGSMGALLGQRGIVTNCPDALSVEKPEEILRVHRDYLDAGADVIIADTFGSHPAKLARGGYADRLEEIVTAAVRNAREAAGEKAYVALDLGPTGSMLQPVGSMPTKTAVDGYRRQIEAGRGADFALIETMTDIAEARSAMLACRMSGIPFAASFSYETNGRTMTGGTPECAMLIAQALGAFAAGTNCSGGPESVLEPVRRMRSAAALPLIVQPNAGIPEVRDGATVYPCGAEQFAELMRVFLEEGTECVGGCCGTTPKHIARLSELAKQYPANVRDQETEPMVCSQRKYATLAEALENTETVTDVDDLYDLDDDTLLALLDLRETDADEVADLVGEAMLATTVPLGFIADGAEALEEALRTYAGIAAVRAPEKCGDIAALYGAHIIA